MFQSADGHCRGAFSLVWLFFCRSVLPAQITHTVFFFPFIHVQRLQPFVEDFFKLSSWRRQRGGGGYILLLEHKVSLMCDLCGPSVERTAVTQHCSINNLRTCVRIWGHLWNNRRIQNISGTGELDWESTLKHFPAHSQKYFQFRQATLLPITNNCTGHKVSYSSEVD